MSRNKNKKKATKLFKRNVCWILFGVVLSLLPFSTIIYAVLLEYDIKFNNYIPDMILVVISIGFNFINLCIDIWKKLNPILRIIISLISMMIIIIWWGFYSFIKGGVLKNPNTCLIFTINFIFIVCWLAGGIIINCKTSKKEKIE